MPKGDITPYIIEFDNGNTAQYVRVSKVEEADDIAAALKIKKPSALMTIAGGAKNLDAHEVNQLAALFSRGIARAVYDCACLVITGGTNFGVMRMMGQGIADRGRAAPLIGIAPADLVQLPGAPPPTGEKYHSPLDPHHSHFVLVEGNRWGDETATMYRLARYLADGIPSITILANGGSITKLELLYTIRQGRPVIIIEGSERLADEVAGYWRAHQAAKKGEATKEDEALLEKLQQDYELQEIIEEGDLTFFSIDGKAADLEALIQKLLPTALIDDRDLLQKAWQQFGLFDQSATVKSLQFRRIRKTILVVGVLAVTFAVASTAMNPLSAGRFLNQYLSQFSAAQWAVIFGQTIHIIALMLPIIGAALLAGANRFHPGENWVTLRGGGEDIKKEIYRYRSRVYPYDQQDRTEKLARKIEQIGNRVVGGNVTKHELKPYTGSIPPQYISAAGDDGFSPLSDETYLNYRLQDQITFFEGRAAKIFKSVRLWQWTIIGSGGLGTFLGLMGLDALIAITTSIGAALAGYMEMVQAESTLRGYNETAQLLKGIRTRWVSTQAKPQSPSQQRYAFHKMVEDTEHVLVTERSGWIAEMNEALKEFQTTGSDTVLEDTAPPTV